MKQGPAGGWVALVLAVGLIFGFNLFCLGVLYDAIVHHEPLSENATQVLTGWGGGMIGILGSYIGYRVASTSANGAALARKADELPADDSRGA